MNLYRQSPAPRSATGQARLEVARATPAAATQPILPQSPRRQHGPRKPTLAGVAKQASKAGIEVARYEVKPDGTVVVVTGAPAGDINPWDEVLVDAADTKRPS